MDDRHIRDHAPGVVIYFVGHGELKMPIRICLLINANEEDLPEIRRPSGREDTGCDGVGSRVVLGGKSS